MTGMSVICNSVVVRTVYNLALSNRYVRRLNLLDQVRIILSSPFKLLFYFCYLEEKLLIFSGRPKQAIFPSSA